MCFVTMLLKNKAILKAMRQRKEQREINGQEEIK
jgi:hypothetical protein